MSSGISVHPERRRFATLTLGCKLNQFDTAALEAELLRRGLERSADPLRAEILIVNTCTVTARADAEARRLVRRLRRRNPTCTLVVAGCYAEREPERLRELGADLVLGNRAKAALAAHLDGLGLGGPPNEAAVVALGERGCDGAAGLPAALFFGDRTRAFLKVQEGCDLVCSYCIIPQVRGPSRSVAPAALGEAARRLAAAGYREIVLTGVNTGDYGKDLAPPLRLPDLLDRLLAACTPARLRLNSLEPRTLTAAVIERLAAQPRLCRHLQVPLQSGSDRILRLMRRNYRVQDYLDRLERLQRAVEDAALGADVIVGFPGETEEDFERTYRTIAASPLNYLHVFPYSPRPGTAAAALPGAVPPGAVQERSARLRELGRGLWRRFCERFLGRELEAIVLGERADGGLRALTDNYIEATLPARAAGRGELVRVRILALEGDTVRAQLATPDSRPRARTDPISGG